MKIAMITNNYKPFVGGVPILIERLSKGLCGLGHEVWIFAPGYDGNDYLQDQDEIRKEDEEEHVIRYCACKRKLGNGMVIPGIWDTGVEEIFQREEFDLIHVHHPMLAGNMAVYLSHKYDIPLVYTYHTRYEEYLHYLPPFSGAKKGSIGEKILLIMQKLLPHYIHAYIKKCHMIFAPSEDMARYVREMDEDAYVKVLPTGIRREACEKDEERSCRIRRKYGENRPYLLCTVSRMEKEKNLYFLLRAAEELEKQMGQCFRILMVGGGSELPKLQQYVKERGLSDVVVFTGEVPQEQVKDYLFASDMFLFASKSETQGIVLAEAMAAGLPVVAVEACGVRDIVENGKNGYMTGEDVEHYVKCIVKLLSEGECRRKMGDRACQTAASYQGQTIAELAWEGYRKALEIQNGYHRDMETGRRREIYAYEGYHKEHTVTSLLHLFKMS